MNESVLKRLQAASSERYLHPKPGHVLPVEIKQPEKPVDEIKVKKTRRKQRVIYPDLMAVKTTVPVEVKKVITKNVFDKPQEPQIDFRKLNKFEGRAIYDPKTRIRDILRAPIPEKEDKPFKRPPAIYDNKKSLYGIDYNDL